MIIRSAGFAYPALPANGSARYAGDCITASQENQPAADPPAPTASTSKDTGPAAVLRRSPRRLVELVGFESNWYLVILAAGIGIVTGSGAIGFMWLLHQAERLFLNWPPFAHGEGHHIPWWLLIAGPTVGALICGLIVYFGAPEAKGHGVPEVMVALYRNKGRIRPQVALFKSLASAFTIGSGGSAGAEGPIVQIGSAIGSNVGRLLKVSPEHTGTLLGCGAAAGIASVFNAPIAGIFFVLEILLRDFSLKTFTPIVIASVFSAATTQALSSDYDAIFKISGDLQHYQFTIFEVPYYVGLGLLCGAIAVSFTRILDWFETVYERVRIHPVLKPVTGAVLLGLCSVAILKLGPSVLTVDGELPAFYGNGYPFITSCLQAEMYESHEAGALMLALGIGLLVVMKSLATCLTLGSGGSGGIFAPSLFLGATAGGAFGIFVNYIDPFGIEHMSPGAYALVGMAAVVAGTTHAPLTAILILFEITGDYKVILPIMLAAVLSTIVAQLLLPDSIYTIKVRRKGIRVGQLSDLTVLRRISVDRVPLAPPITVLPSDPAQELIRLAEMHDAVDFIVVDEQQHYLGMVTADDLRTALLQIEALPLLVVEELMRTDLPTTTPDETLDIVMDKFSEHDAASVAVVKGTTQPVVIGRLTRSRMMRQYHHALDQT
ncbi:MAG: chloride channel protein [Planctomycetes bacterium]|nr:chloride channel protein [Planctomycetota bacterium]